MTESSTRATDVVVVTGASSGIGKATALRYAQRHASLVLAARSGETLNRVREECLAMGAHDVAVHPTDIGRADDVERLFGTAVERFGHVDVVVQCAAITAFGRFEDVPVDVFDAVLRTNLLGAANVARCALRHFHQREAGHLVMIGSLLGSVAVPYQSCYVASKFALNGLVRSLRIENRRQPGVRIHGIYPGPVNTEVYATASNYFGRTPRVPPAAVEPAAIVSAIVRATSSRRSGERQVGWMNWPVITAYRRLPALYDAVIGPFLRVVAFTGRAAEGSAGNALDTR